jgi:hypothetical protein
MTIPAEELVQNAALEELRPGFGVDPPLAVCLILTGA